MKGWRDSVLAGGDEHGKGMEEEGEGAKGGREEYRGKEAVVSQSLC